MKYIALIFIFFPFYKVDIRTVNRDQAVSISIRSQQQLRSNINWNQEVYLTDRGSGVWKVDDNDSSSKDNDWNIIVDAAGRRWKRQWDGETVQADWFGAVGDGTTDNTIALQKAVDAAYRKKLQFTTGKVYRTNKIYLPSSITVDVNKAILKPALSPQYNGSIFALEPLRNNSATGIYSGGKPQLVKLPDIKRVPHVEVCNAIVDLEMTMFTFCDASLMSADNTVVDSFYVHDNIIRNFSRRAIGATAPSFVTDTSGYFNNVIFEKNDIRYGGAQQGLIMAADGKTGDTTLQIETLDHGDIASRMMPGMYVNIGSHLTGSTLDVNGYTSTNCMYRIKSYNVFADDHSKAQIIIGSGGYSSKDGYLPDPVNAGLKAPVLKNAFLIAAEPYQNPLLTVLPDFSGAAGSTVLQRTTFNDRQNAAHKNLWPGMKFVISSNAYNGTYTITSVSNDAITIQPALTNDVDKQSLIPYGKTAPCSYINGNIKNSYIRGNVFYGASHGINFNGIGRKGVFNEDLDNRSYIEGNEYYYCWMSNETQSGNTVRSTLPYAVLSNLSLKRGDTLIQVPDAAKYRSTQKDIDADGSPDKVLTLASTTDEKITAQNSLAVGDLITWYGLHEVYKITDISLNWSSAPVITIQRWDQKKRSIIPGGIDATVVNSNTYFRVYSLALGQEGSLRYQKFSNNKFYYVTRNMGGTGYHLSVRAYDLEIVNNYFEECEKGAFELEAYNLLIKNNTFNFYVFDGSKPMPSLAKTNGGPGRGFNGWGTTVAQHVLIEDNTFSGYQPPQQGYSMNSGAFTIGQSAFTTSPAESLIIKNNRFNGVERMMTNIVTISKIRNVSYPSFYYNYVEYSDNTITLADDFLNDGFYREFLGAKIVISGNSIQIGKGRRITTFNLFKANQKPNPELFDSTGKYDILIQDKQYPMPADLHFTFPSSKIVFKAAKVSIEK
ncbi:MAG: hypothetical protein QM802_21475 [Agriterribacter sp.]